MGSTETSNELRPTADRIARSAVVVIGVLTFAKLFSLTEKWVGLDRFGVGADWGTFAAANQLPEQLYVLIAGGALAYAFIPVFGGFLTRGDREGAWKLASNMLNTIFLAALFLAALAFLLAPWLVSTVVAPGFTPERAAQTANLMRILLVSLIIFSISGLTSGILHTHQHFLLPALAPILFDAGNLFGVVVLAPRIGIYGAAIGAVLGSVLHFGIQVPGLIRVRARWRPYLNWRDPALREVIRLMIPRALGLALANANMLVAYNIASRLGEESVARLLHPLSPILANNIASRLGEESVAAFNRGYALMQVPQTLIGTAMGIVIFPTLAVLSAAGDLNGKRSAMSGALRFILIASIPAAVAMFVAGRPLVGVLEGGQFDSEGATRVFQILQLWALGIITQSGVEIVARSFYADKDMLTPLFVAGLVAALNLVLALVFVQWFNVAGLALANSLAVGVELVLLMSILRRRWQGIDEQALITSTIKAVIAAAVMGAVMVLFSGFLDRLSLGAGRLESLLRGGLELGVGGVVYIGVALALRMTEIRELPRLILRRRGNPAAVAAEATGD